jgi:hypothetical protein
MSVGFLAIGFITTCCSWVLINRYGRRPIYNCGLAVLTLIMFLIGILDCSPNYLNRPGIIWAECILLVSTPEPIYSQTHQIVLLFANVHFRSYGTVFLILQSVLLLM